MPLPTIRVSSNEQGSSRARQSPDDDPPEDRSSGYHEDLSMSQSGSNSRWLKADAEDFVPHTSSQCKSETGSLSGALSVGSGAVGSRRGITTSGDSSSSSSFQPGIEDGDEITWLNRMACEHGVNTSRSDDEGPYKLFVGCLPFDTTEHDLFPLFAQFGEIVELAIQRDREGRSKGCAWLKYLTRESCDDCIARLHGQFYVGHVRAAMQVKYATGELEKRENRVYLIGLPRDETVMAEHELLTALDAYGEIREFVLFRQGGRSVGACFVKFTAREPAAALVQACHLRQFHVNDNIHLPAVRAYFATQIRRFSSMGSSQSPNSQLERGQPLKGPSSRDVKSTAGFEDKSQQEESLRTGGGGGSQAPGVDRSPDPTSTGLLRPADSESNPETRQPPSVLVPSPNLPQEGLTPAKLFVGCLPYSKTTLDLAQLFGQFGPILEVALLTNSEGKSKGAAFVTFAYAPDAEAAMSMNEYCFPGSSRSINVSYATNQTWVPGGMGNNNNNNGRNALPRGQGGNVSRTGGGGGGGTQSYFPLKHGIPGAAGSPPLMFTSNRNPTVSSVASTAYDQSPPFGPLASVGGILLPVESLHQGHHHHHPGNGAPQLHDIPDLSPTGILADDITNFLLEYEESLSSELPPL